MCAPHVIDSIKHRVSNNRIVAIWMGITCASFSRARRGKPGGRGWPPPLRGDSADLVWGLPNLSPKDKDRVAQGNRLALQLVCYVKLCIKFGVPIVIENPETSRLWILPPFLKLLEQANVITLHQCQFGASHKKPTKLAGWNIDLSSLEQKCTTTKGLCSCSGVAHVRLEGITSSGKFSTANASAYPVGLCSAVSKVVHSLV